MWNPKKNEDLLLRRKKAAEGGGLERIAKQHAQGKLTARERIEVLFDEGSFIEINGLVETRMSDFGMDKRSLPGDGVITGYGKINGRLAFASSEDFTVIGGTLGEYHSLKICKLMDLALSTRAPLITINDSGGARIEEGIDSLSGYSGMFLRNTRASGVIPQIAVIMGPCAGGACYSPALCDFIFMVNSTSRMFITGPQVVKTATSETISPDELGGAQVHMQTSGVAHFAYDTDVACLRGVRKLLSYLPQNSDAPAQKQYGIPVDRSTELQKIVPDNGRRGYDVRQVIYTMIDIDSFFEVQAEFAQNIVVGLARMEGNVVGFVANQPSYMGGALDVHASDKAARFIRFCDCFRIPLVTLVDVPAFLPGKEQEHAGIIRHGAKLLFAYSEATVPKITLIMRKAYGGAYIAMNSKNMGADLVFAWPIAEIAVMGAEGAVGIVFKHILENALDKEAERQRLIGEYEQRFMTPYIAAKRGLVDEVILPEETRERICRALETLSEKRETGVTRRHGNIPL